MLKTSERDGFGDDSDDEEEEDGTEEEEGGGGRGMEEAEGEDSQIEEERGGKAGNRRTNDSVGSRDVSSIPSSAQVSSASATATATATASVAPTGRSASSDKNSPLRPGAGASAGTGTIFSSRGAGVPLRRSAGYDHPPTWLQSTSRMGAKPPTLAIATLSVTLLDYGYGAHALLTVRQIDAEKMKRLTLEQQSRTGVLGRIVSGVWVKLAEVKCCSGLSSIGRQ
jgi:hypothetical protein